MKIRPLGDRVVVLPIEKESRTASGIVLPESAKEKPQEGRIVAVGNGNRDDDGERIPLDVKVDDVVLYAKYAGTEVKIDDIKYLILRESDLLGIVES
jgi:chaperonin GroES